MIRWLLILPITCKLSAQTYTRDIAPIVYKHCTPCHRAGEAAPFSLSEYPEVRRHAKQIADVTNRRIMPPWKPEPGKGTFEGERRLTDRDIQLLQDWVAQGVPEGDPNDLPPTPHFVEGWQLGKPDLIASMDRPFRLAASGSDVFRNFILRVPLNRARYVRAIEIRPGVKQVVHHANLLIDRQRVSRRKDGKDGLPGFPGMDARIETRSFDPESHFLFWKPGTPTREEPEGMAWEIEPNTDLVLNMHLQPSGKAEMIQASVGFYFTDTPPRHHPMLLQLEHDGALDIAAGQRDFVVTDRLRLPVDIDVLGIYPHAHYVARDMQAYATLPDGTRRWLIHIKDWDINWQAVYHYQAPVFLPKGTVVSMRYVYDNSAENPRNPSHPPKRVVSGDRSTDEMSHLWLQVLPREQNTGRTALHKAVMLRRLEKYPGDFLAEFSLGSILQTEGRLPEASRRYRNALATRPGDAVAHNALGSVLLANGKTSDAAAEFRTAIQSEPDYADAHYNLARLLLADSRIPEAISQLREVIRVEPLDAPALSDLGAALYMSGDVETGFRLLRQSIELQPENFNAHYNLGQALAAAGKLTEAAKELREALRLKPGDPDTTSALRQMGRN